MEDCLFCKIVKNEIPSKIVYEDENVLAFWDIHPLTPIHILFIPKRHITSLATMNDDEAEVISKIYIAINKVANEQGIKEKGYRVIVNCGEDGGQEVKHLHFHLMGGTKLGTKIVN